MIDDEYIELLQSASKDTELWEALAQCLWAHYEALRRAGFGPNQAMDYLSRQGLGVKLKDIRAPTWGPPGSSR